MEILTTQEQLNSITKLWEKESLTWAFVPTMGALHEGHLTLVKEALTHFPRVIVSVFVNPTQFDRADDLARYPRQPNQDAAMLEGVGAHAVFMPGVNEIYPNGTEIKRKADLGGLDTRYEGAARPGHFDGVVQVVRRLVELVDPHAMYMGQKDAQQVAVLRRAAAQEFWKVKIFTVPTVREASGLAMSSRNGQLTEAGFAKAAIINACLEEATTSFSQGSLPRDIEAFAKTKLIEAGLKPEYFDFIDGDSFMQLPNLPKEIQTAKRKLIVTVAWLDGVRLIDNKVL